MTPPINEIRLYLKQNTAAENSLKPTSTSGKKKCVLQNTALSAIILAIKFTCCDTMENY